MLCLQLQRPPRVPYNIISKSRKKFLATTYKPFSRSLYRLGPKGVMLILCLLFMYLMYFLKNYSWLSIPIVSHRRGGLQAVDDTFFHLSSSSGSNMASGGNFSISETMAFPQNFPFYCTEKWKSWMSPGFPLFLRLSLWNCPTLFLMAQ